MADKKIITGINEDEIWQKISKDLNDDNFLDYHATIKHGGQEIQLDIDVDLGGGFEGGYSETSLKSVLPFVNDFRFAIHRQHFIDKIGKFFGMQDVIIGYPDFDQEFIVKTNDELKVKELFGGETTRHAFQLLKEDFTFAITTHDNKSVLEYSTDSGLNDPAILKNVYNAFYAVLSTLNSPAY